MEIDWFTTGAQILNFLILIWLLQKFLYKPLLRAIDAREAEIMRRLGDAAALSQEAQTERQALAKQQAELAQKTDAILAEARKEAAELTHSEREKARMELIQHRKIRDTERGTERQGMAREIIAAAGGTLTTLVDKVLHDLTDSDLHDQSITRFIGMLSTLDTETKARLSKSLNQNSGFVETARPLTKSQLQQLKQALSALGENSAGIAFKVDDTLACGGRFVTGALEVSWTLDAYLDGFETAMLSATNPAEDAETAPRGGMRR